MSITNHDKMTIARSALVLDAPFFASLALRLKMVEKPGSGTMATDGKHIIFDPDFVNKFSIDEIKGVICHEVMHVAFCHHARMRGRDKDKWNVACDYVVNDVILEAGFSLPDGCLVDKKYANMTAEMVYNLLPQNPKGEKGSDGKGNYKAPGWGLFEECEGDPEVEESEWQVAVEQAAKSAKMMGKGGAFIDRLVGELLEPKIDWRKVLHTFVDRVAKNDYTWTYPNRRFIGRGIYLPILRNNEIGNLVLAVDTSGSISPDDLKVFLSEIQEILRTYRTTATLIYCDAEVQRVETLHSDEVFDTHPAGGGGTDFRPVFDYVEDEGESDTSCLIYFTDMMGVFPDDSPAYPVLWIDYNTYTKEENPPPFGEYIKMGVE